MFSMNSLADRIKHVRTASGLSQAAFAREIGVSRSAINQIEAGITQALKAATIVAIERTTGFSGAWVETGRGNPRKRPGPLPAGKEDQVDRIYSALAGLPKEHLDKIEIEIDFLESLNKPSE